MIDSTNLIKGFHTPEARWARLGPYYAMFPLDFAFQVVEKYSKKGDYVIDPFAGRGSSVYAAGILERYGLGIEINPVGWLYGMVKVNPADKKDVIVRLFEIYSKRNYFKKKIEKLPLFYRMCYCDEVLKFLLSVRKYLCWQDNQIDATLMSIIMACLHGRIGEGLSNQMKMTKSMGMNYSIKWWKKQKLNIPPEINPYEFLLKKIKWRYEKGTPSLFKSKIILGDSTCRLKSIIDRANKKSIKYSLLFTSPPYYGVTDYHADQWLRLWLLGGSEIYNPTQDKYKKRFASKIEYYKLLDSVFGQCSTIMSKKSVVYVRTDKREFSYKATRELLKKHFPNHNMKIVKQPFKTRTQTQIHGNTSSVNGEIDIILMRNY